MTGVVDLVRDHSRVREGLRQILTRLSVYRPGSEPDIVIFACPRSGSTWLMELIAAAPRMRFVNEPDNSTMVYESGIATGLEDTLPPELRKIVVPPPGDGEVLRRHLVDRRVTRIRGPYNVFGPQYHVFANRRVLKLVAATALADWIITERPFHLTPVYLVRHPVATALSMTKSEIILRAQANLSHPEFCRRHLGNRLTQFGWQVLESGSAIEKFVLEWCLYNLVPYRSWRENPDGWSLMTYEEMVLQPVDSLHALGAELAFPITPRMERLVRVPSASTSAGRRHGVTVAASYELVNRWRHSIDDALEERAFEIVDRFGIELYEYGRTLAADPFLRFADTRALEA